MHYLKPWMIANKLQESVGNQLDRVLHFVYLSDTILRSYRQLYFGFGKYVETYGALHKRKWRFLH